MSTRFCFGLMFCLTAALPGCGEGPQRQPSDAPLSTAKAVEPPKSTGAKAVEPPKSTGAADAPEKFKVRFETSKGDFVIEATRSWSPHGYDRFYELVQSGFFDDCRFFRVIARFMVQFGINGNPEVQAKWHRNIPDDPVVESNKRGYVTFAKTGAPNSRSTQLFINFGDNSRLDRDGFSPFGRVVEGMEVVDLIYSGYGERPDQNRLKFAGNAYLEKEFPKLDYIKKATILKSNK